MANRKRPGRVRTKRNNRREALELSTMAPEDYNIRPDEPKSIVCPDCRTWRRIMGTHDLKIREHCISDKVAEGRKHERCPGSNQVVVVGNIDVRRWQARQDRLLRDAMPQDNRHAARQHYKPIPAPAPAVVQMPARPTTAVPQAVNRSAEIARPRHTLHLHYTSCTACTAEQWCPVAEELARQVLAAEQLRNREAAARHRDVEHEEKAVATRRRQRGREWASFDEHGTFWPGGHPALATH